MTQINNTLTLRQLRCIAADKGIDGYSRMTKDQLIAALAEQERTRLVNRFAAAYERLNPSAIEQIADRN